MKRHGLTSISPLARAVRQMMAAAGVVALALGAGVGVSAEPAHGVEVKDADTSVMTTLQQADPQEPNDGEPTTDDPTEQQQPEPQAPTQCEPGTTVYKCCGCSRGFQKVITCHCGSNGKPICGGPCHFLSSPACGWNGCFN